MQSGVAVHELPVLGHGVAARSGWLRPWIAVLLAGVMVAVGCVTVLRTLPGETSGPVTTTSHGLESLPLAAQGPVSASLGQDAPAYRLEGLRAVNPEQHLHARFSRRGVMVASGAAQLGMALLLITHDLTIVRRMAERIAVMTRGEIVETGPTGAVFAGPRHPYTKRLLAAEPKGRAAPTEPGAAKLMEAAGLRVWFPIRGGVLVDVGASIRATTNRLWISCSRLIATGIWS